MTKRDYKLYYVEYEYLEGGRECKNYFYYHSHLSVLEARREAEQRIKDTFKQKGGNIITFKEKPLHIGYKGDATEWQN